MRSRRCAPCDLDWPTGERYKTCPACGRDTYPGPLDPMTYDEAREFVNEMDAASAKRASDNARMDEAFVQAWARDAGIDLSRTAMAEDGAPESELR